MALRKPKVRAACSRAAVDVEFTVERLHAFAHANETKAGGLPFAPLRKSFAIVVHGHFHDVPVPGIVDPRHVNIRTGRGSVASDVGQALLDDAIHGNVDGLSHSLDCTVELQLAHDFRMPVTPRRDEILQCFTQPQMIERGRPEIGRAHV